MNHLIESIVNKDHTASKELFEQYMNQLMNEKLDEVKKMIAARIDEVTVHPDGMVHTSTGRHILPSVRRAELQLSEGRKRERAEIVQGDIKKTRENIKKAKARIAAKKNKIAPLMPAERKEELRQKTAQMAAKRAERLKNREKRKAAEERAKEAENIAKEAGMTIKQAVDIISRQPPKPTFDGSEIPLTKDNPFYKEMQKRAAADEKRYARNMKKNPPKGPVKKPGLLKRIFGLKEEALERAKAIVEAKHYSGTGSKVMIPKPGDHVVYSGYDPDKIIGIFNKRKEAENFANESGGHYPGPHKE